MLIIPKDYTLSKFLQYSGRPERCGNTYRASCPSCREGKSWLIKKRLYFFPEKNSFYCHNCSKGWNAYRWLTDVCQLPFEDILRELKEGNYDNFLKVEELEEKKDYLLPKDCINLENPNQLEFYKNNKIVQTALTVLTKRRLLTALNRPKSFFVSVNDFKYKKRLVIPFYNSKGDIEYFTGRSLFKGQDPKFLNKLGDKTIFNLYKINPDIPYIFIFEGPIDAMFVENGIAISGIDLTEKQKQILKTEYPNHKLIWVLDNPKLDESSKNKLMKLLKKDEDVAFFCYPDNFSNFKDINDYCIKYSIDSISHTEMLKGVKSGVLSLVTLN